MNIRGIKVKILVYKSGHVDMGAPVHMTDDQRGKFIDFMKKTFQDVEVSEREEKTRNKPTSVNTEPKRWEPDEYLALLGPESNEVLSAKWLRNFSKNRSPMSIKMKRGSFVPEFISWMKSKGYISIKQVDRDMIAIYLEERGGL